MVPKTKNPRCDRGNSAFGARCGESASAYLDYFFDALAQGAISLGLTEEQAKSYVLSMAKGTIALIEETKKDPLVLGKEVCSPGGSTMEGVHVMIENGLYEMMGKAVEATYRKNQKMC